MDSRKWFNLQLFGEGGEGAATGDNGPAAEADAGSNATPAANKVPTFEELLKSNPDYKRAHGAAVRDAVTKRVGALSQKNEAYAAVTDVLAARYGMELDDDGNYDLAELAERVRNDRSGLEAASLEEGISPDIKDRNLEYDFKTKREAAKQRGAEKQAQEQARAQAVVEQVRAMEQKYPGFDMDAEMRNPDFAGNVFMRGLRVEDAYYLAHRNEITQGVAAVTAKETQAAAAAHIAAGHGRPAEGAAGRVHPGPATMDPRSFTKEQRADLRRRVDRGEKVYL